MVEAPRDVLLGVPKNRKNRHSRVRVFGDYSIHIIFSTRRRFVVYLTKWEFQKQRFFSVSLLLDCFILLICTLHRVDIEATEFFFCHNNLNLTYGAKNNVTIVTFCRVRVIRPWQPYVLL